MIRHYRSNRRLLRRVAGSLPAAAVLGLVVSVSNVAAADTGGGGAQGFAATFQARAGRAAITSCPSVGPDGKKIEARYEGTFSLATTDRRFAMRTSVEILVDGGTGLGTAEGKWQLVDAADAEVYARGELLAVVSVLDPPDPDLDPPDPDLDPPDPDLELHGLLIGLAQPSDPAMPAQRLVGNVTASFTEGTLNFSGVVGDSTADPPTEGELLPAVLIASDPC